MKPPNKDRAAEMAWRWRSAVLRCGMNFKDLLDAQNAGSTFAVDASGLNLSDADFHSLAAQWERNGGGEGFTLAKIHRESQTEHRYIDLVMLRRDEK